MPTRPPLMLFVLVMLIAAGALLTEALKGQAAQGFDSGRGLLLAGCGLLAGIGGFKVGRMMAAGQLCAGPRVCRSCNARRTTSAAFCESCHRRD